MRHRRVTKYTTESALCADFIEWARPQGWAAYAETAGWDILLVDGAGRQIGVQAKLRFTPKLIHQTIPDEWHEGRGPDFRAVLIPEEDGGIRGICGLLGLNLFRASYFGKNEFCPDISDHLLLDWNPSQRCKLPEYVPDVAAGASGPVCLTDWKIKALRACAVLELDGFITAKQIRELGMDARRWIHPGHGWLQARHLKRGEYVRGPQLTFPEQHRTVYATIKAELIAQRKEMEQPA